MKKDNIFYNYINYALEIIISIPPYFSDIFFRTLLISDSIVTSHLKYDIPLIFLSLQNPNMGNLIPSLFILSNNTIFIPELIK